MKLIPVNLDSDKALDAIREGEQFQVEGDDGSCFKGEPVRDPIRGLYFRASHPGYPTYRLHVGRVRTLHRLNYLR